MSEKIEELIDELITDSEIAGDRPSWKTKRDRSTTREALISEIAKMEVVIEAVEDAINLYPDLVDLANAISALKESRKE